MYWTSNQLKCVPLPLPDSISPFYILSSGISMKSKRRNYNKNGGCGNDIIKKWGKSYWKYCNENPGRVSFYLSSLNIFCTKNVFGFKLCVF